jgi:hypothetical protein
MRTQRVPSTQQVPSICCYFKGTQVILGGDREWGKLKTKMGLGNPGAQCTLQRSKKKAQPYPLWRRSWCVTGQETDRQAQPKDYTPRYRYLGGQDLSRSLADPKMAALSSKTRELMALV